MIRLIAVASLLVGCRVSLEEEEDVAAVQACAVGTSQLCLDAANHSDLAWIEANIFTASCNYSGCHSSATDLGKLDLRPGMSHDRLVGVSSLVDPTRKLVVPGDVNASYLMLMVRDVPPAMASPAATAPPNGYMPKGGNTLCCQKLEAIERWIEAGAPSM